jgi:hypothetical protein
MWPVGSRWRAFFRVDSETRENRGFLAIRAFRFRKNGSFPGFLRKSTDLRVKQFVSLRLHFGHLILPPLRSRKAFPAGRISLRTHTAETISESAPPGG